MPFGLADPEVINQHSKRFRDILANYEHKKNVGRDKPVRLIPGEKLPQLVMDLCAMFGEFFRRHSHPEPTLAFQNLGTSGTMANFQSEAWQVAVNDALVFAKGDFPINIAPVVYSSLYHEFRHGEQFSLMIRYAWAQHPLWLRYQNLTYQAERNELVPKAARVSDAAIHEAYDEWRRAVLTMSDAAVEAKIKASLSTVAGASVSPKAVRMLAKYPLSTLAGASQGVIDQAALWYQSRFRTWAEEFGGRSKVLDPGKMIDADETTAANIAVADASVYADSVDEQLQEWNAGKPTAFPNWAVSLNSPEGKKLSQLRTASGAFDAGALKACHGYLKVMRTFAIEQIDIAHKWYEGVPLEKDTHAVEREVEKTLKLSSKVVDKVAKSTGVMKDTYLPEPKDWATSL